LKQLYLTVEQKVLNEAAQQRLDQFEDGEDDYTEPRDSSGRSADDYESLGLPPSKELIELEKTQTNSIRFDLEKDYDFYETDCVIRMSDYVMCIDSVDGGSVVYLKNGLNVEVLEESDDILAQIWYQNRSWWEKIKEWAENKFKQKSSGSTKK